MHKEIIDLKTKIYQMFILGLEGVDLDNNPNLVSALELGLGGVIFFTQNIKSKEQTKKLTAQIRKKSVINPFLSIDQEGGRVERTENIFGKKEFLSAKFAAQKGEDFLREQTKQISLLLKELGLNLNFAPVLDVNTNPDNPIIGERAFSSDTQEVIQYGNIVVKTYLDNGIMPCTKHFPGHGDANTDSHISLPQIDLTLDVLEKNHIRAFRDVFSPMVMVAHLYCTAFDAEVIPSSLSKNVIGYLRNRLNYEGLVITDDMVMGGVLDIDSLEACRLAINAGVNILLYRSSDNETIKIIDNLAKIAETDDLLRKNIENSFEKIMAYKSLYNIT